MALEKHELTREQSEKRKLRFDYIRDSGLFQFLITEVCEEIWRNGDSIVDTLDKKKWREL
jgi:hypothetical protein